MTASFQYLLYIYFTRNAKKSELISNSQVDNFDLWNKYQQFSSNFSFLYSVEG